MTANAAQEAEVQHAMSTLLSPPVQTYIRRALETRAAAALCMLKDFSILLVTEYGIETLTRSTVKARTSPIARARSLFAFSSRIRSRKTRGPAITRASAELRGGGQDCTARSAVGQLQKSVL